MFLNAVVFPLLAAASAVRAGNVDLLTDITKISKHFGQITPYSDNPENYFGVEYVGLPNGCQIVSTILLE